MWNCPVAFRVSVVTCDLVHDLTTPYAIPLLAGVYAIVDVTVFVAANVQGEVQNTASVAAPTTDPSLVNNSDLDVSTVHRLRRSDDRQDRPVHRERRLSPDVDVRRHNNGPSDCIATLDDPIVVSDTLPASVMFESAVVTGVWNCTHDSALVGGVITCRYAATIPGHCCTSGRTRARRRHRP